MKLLANIRAVLLPHELAFMLFLGVTWARLVVVAGCFARDALLFLLLLALCPAVAGWCRRAESGLRWRVRLWAYVGVMTASYFALRTAVPLFSTFAGDEWLQRLDERLLGGSAAVQLEGMSRPTLTELMSVFYALHYPIMIAAWMHYDRRGLQMMKRFFAGFFTVFGLGFLGYTLVPAAGPYANAAQFGGPLHGGWLTDVSLRIVVEGSNRVDCFPSLHVAMTAFILGFDWRHARRRFWVQLVPCAGLWVSTVFLRYHYLVDVIAGFVLAGAVLACTGRSGAHAVSDAVSPAEGPDTAQS